MQFTPKKANALFYEFEETGMNRQLGYSSPADLINKYPAFFWNSVSMHIEDGLKLLNLTSLAGNGLQTCITMSFAQSVSGPYDGPAASGVHSPPFIGCECAAGVEGAAGWETG